MTSLTLSTLLIVVLGAFGRRGYGVALALGGATVAGAAIVVGGVAVPTFYTVAVGAAVIALWRTLHNPAEVLHIPGVPSLMFLLGWATVVTLLAPVVFHGTATLASDGEPLSLVAGGVTSSNIAQIGYLFMGICVVIVLALSARAGPGLVGVVAGSITILSAWAYLHQTAGLPYPEGLFDNSPRLVYIESAPGGKERFRGILSEPASLASFCLVSISYMVVRAQFVRRWRRIGVLLVAGVALHLGIVSTSATFVVAGVAVLCIAGATFLTRMMFRWTAVRLAATLGACILVLAALWLLPIMADFVQIIVDEKLLSSSYGDRSNADASAYELFLHTLGLGVGLGANRASSFLPGMLSTVGLVGTAVLAAVIVGLLRRGSVVPEYRPVVWALVSLIVVKVISGPDLSDPSGLLWITIGLLARSTLISADRMWDESRGLDGRLHGREFRSLMADTDSERSKWRPDPLVQGRWTARTDVVGARDD